MTKFDPDATPESEAFFDELYKSTEHYFYKVYEANKDCDDLFHVVEHGLSEAIMFSKSLETRVRVAEEKLRIAMEVLTTSCVYDYTDVQTALKEIYEVDP